MELLVGKDQRTTLAWLVSALSHARSKNQTKLVGYLEAIMDDAVFEMESNSRKTR
jgi:hypothetical protein